MQVDFIMRRCQFCGKSSQKGNKISHSAIKTIKRTYPNLRVKRLIINGKKVKVRICAKCLKSLSKKVEPDKNPS